MQHFKFEKKIQLGHNVHGVSGFGIVDHEFLTKIQIRERLQEWPYILLRKTKKRKKIKSLKERRKNSTCENSNTVHVTLTYKVQLKWKFNGFGFPFFPRISTDLHGFPLISTDF